MKVTFEGVTRDLDLAHIRLRHAVKVQEFTGLPLMDWQRALFTRDMDALAGGPLAEDKITPLTDTGWIVNMAAAHWLMLAQNDDEVPPLDDEYDVDVLGFTLALTSAAVDEAKGAQQQAAPKAPPGRRAPASRQTAARKTSRPPAAPPSSPGS